ncbi:cryptococcal mannosyltransferase 1-domain-containing protein [Aspergillus crustosus]
MATPLLPIHSTPEDRLSIDSQESYDLDEDDLKAYPSHLERITQQIPSLWSSQREYPRRSDYTLLIPVSRCYKRVLFRISYYLFIILSSIIALVVITATFYPSYTNPPPHYTSLYNEVLSSNQTGRGNPHNEKIFIAASLYDPDGDLARGHWASSVLDLITLLGEENVYLSIYENDSGEGDAGRIALNELNERVPCNKSLVYEDLDLDELPKVILPDGSARVKRITYLAETRNRVLRPLEDATATRFDKLLYLNDIAFDPVDALQLLFSTNVDEQGVAQYRAACAVDFTNPFKFYDTYATRDLEGYSMGLPFFPWFSDAGSGESRREVLQGKDAVSVRSCWGGMVAFDARFFQTNSTTNPTMTTAQQAETKEEEEATSPARFRALNDTDIFWDASECCLIHADIQAPWEEETETGIYMNPFVRVAYDPTTLSWLPTARRIERLFSLVQYLGNHLIGLPWFNLRREEIPGQRYQDSVFTTDTDATSDNTTEGSRDYRDFERVGTHDSFCGRRGLSVVKPRDWEGGGKGWMNVPIPVP